MKVFGIVVMLIGIFIMLFEFIGGIIILVLGTILVAVSPSGEKHDPEGYDHPNARKKRAPMDMSKLSTEPKKSEPKPKSKKNHTDSLIFILILLGIFIVYVIAMYPNDGVINPR